MSFDDYVNHITQKYRLAISIAVLKSKPEDVSIEQYITTLRNKMEDRNTGKGDQPISICSEDFVFDDDDAGSIINDVFNDIGIAESDNSATIPKDFDVIMRTADLDVCRNMQADSITDTLSLLRNLNANTEKKSNCTLECENLNRITNYEDSQATYNPIASTSVQDVKSKKAYEDPLKQNVIQDENMTEDDYTEHSKYMDSRIAANISRNINKNSYVNINEYKDAITGKMHENINIPEDIVNESNVDQHDRKTTNDLEEFTQSEYSNRRNDCLTSKVSKNLNRKSNAQIKKPINDRCELGMTIDLEEVNHYEYSNEFNTVNKIMKETTVCKNVNRPIMIETFQNDSQRTQLYSLHDFTQNYNHISQSQSENIKIGERWIRGNKETNIDNANITEETYLPSYCCDSINLNSENVDTENTVGIETETQSINNINCQVLEINSGQIQHVIDINGTYYNIVNQSCTVNDKSTIVKKLKNQIYANTGETQSSEKTNNEEAYETKDILATNNANTQDYRSTEDFDEELTVSQEELVSFKVMIELNKVKVFLDRRVGTDGNASDSGYRSDSQTKRAYKTALQLSDNSLNQAAHCLITYLLQCPLAATTRKITNEISLVLGRLIEKLHEEEKYPSFLEDILENIDKLLQDVYEGETCDNVLLKKEENIQRILLLNKSVHILKYTIEKINNILENIHAVLTSEGTYELTNVGQIENMCYIFHMLEALITKYVKNKPISSQGSSQPSQSEENIFLKSSSIKDIWRRKWNPDFKSAKEVDTEKGCALTKCSETLNKIIVECIEGYNLVAFAALQSFNLMQSH